MPASTSPEKIALIEAQGGACHLVDDPRTMSTRRSGSRPSAMGTSSTSSRTPSARPTGGATTTSRSRSSARWHWSGTPFLRGSWSGPEPAERARLSAATRASARYPTQMCVVDPEDSIFYSAGRATRRPSPAGLAHRGHRAPARRGVVPPGRRRPHDPGSGCGVDRDDAPRARAHGTQRRRLDRDQRLGSAAARRRDACARRARQRRHPDLRRRRALRRHLLQRRVGRAIRAWTWRRTRRRSRPSWHVARSPRQRPKPR